jgi:hypothetical protein
MCCDDLVCARCAAPVAEGRCPACRASRDYLHQTSFSLSPQLLIALITVLLALAVLAGYHV